KWFFYERILKVPNYIIFEPDRGDLEVYRLDKNSEQYQIETSDQNQLYWIEEIKLYLGIWEGTRENLTTKWLRFWDEQGNLLLWSSELVEQKRQEIEVEKQCAEQEKQRADKLAAQLRAAGIEPEN
ncbi:MAG: Uma2 family endonuclease, partial [Sphaerospermopsis kisseleviana]